MEIGTIEPGNEGPPEFLNVFIYGKEHRIPYSPRFTVIGAMKQAGMDPPFSCMDGVCGTCVAKLVNGKVRLNHTDALMESDIRKNRILTCQAKLLSRSATVDFNVF